MSSLIIRRAWLLLLLLPSPPSPLPAFFPGVPATVSVGGAEDGRTPKALHVAEAVQAYITVMDSLRLNMCAVDQVSTSKPHSSFFFFFLHNLMLAYLTHIHTIESIPFD
jgi:hypothetical protein